MYLPLITSQSEMETLLATQTKLKKGSEQINQMLQEMETKQVRNSATIQHTMSSSHASYELIYIIVHSSVAIVCSFPQFSGL